MLEHVECPACGAPNLASEMVCFACGKVLRPGPRRTRSPDVAAPWPLWLGLTFGLAAVGLVMCQLASWLAQHARWAAYPAWHLPAAAGALIAAGQVGFRGARRSDQRWWRLSRASEIALPRATSGDTIWTRGQIGCDTPLYPPYVGQPCAYYRYVVREREPGQAGWKETERGSAAVDFRVVDGDKSLYVPCGHVVFDAPVYVDSFSADGDIRQIRAWALPAGLPVSVCGLVVAEGPQPRMDPLGEDLPVVVTWRSPRDYVACVGRRARRLDRWGWLLTFAGVVAFIAGVARL